FGGSWVCCVGSWLDGGTFRADRTGADELPCPPRPTGCSTRCGGCPVSQLATCVAPPPCNWHISTGCVPCTQYSGRTLGHPAVASWPDAGSVCTLTIPAGAWNSVTFRYSRCSCARFMNSAHTGRAECAPSSFSSRLSSKPTHTTQISLDVKPANQ